MAIYELSGRRLCDALVQSFKNNIAIKINYDSIHFEVFGCDKFISLGPDISKEILAKPVENINQIDEDLEEKGDVPEDI